MPYSHCVTAWSKQVIWFISVSFGWLVMQLCVHNSILNSNESVVENFAGSASDLTGDPTLSFLHLEKQLWKVQLQKATSKQHTATRRQVALLKQRLPCLQLCPVSNPLKRDSDVGRYSCIHKTNSPFYTGEISLQDTIVAHWQCSLWDSRHSYPNWLLPLKSSSFAMQEGFFLHCII